ncbi:MAG: hypothetical protein KJ737_22960 [Proteobacteria bacterium]|nr:hypothetical protein [Pseudomonadota bacterium]
MYHTETPSEMSPEERFHEIAVILSRGYVRLKTEELIKLSESNINSEVLLDSFEDQSAHDTRS